MIVRGGLGVLDERAASIDAVEPIERSSIDFYATTRSLYRQNRAAQINNGKAVRERGPAELLISLVFELSRAGFCGLS